MKRSGSAVWTGGLKDGKGTVSAESGILSGVPYSFSRRFENEKGTNPEELIAAAHAGCFAMALAFHLQTAGFNPTELASEAVVSIDKEGGGFRITRSKLTLRAQVPGIERAKFDELANAA